MKKLTLTIAVIATSIVGVLLPKTANAQATSERDLQGFSKLKVSSGIEVIVKQGDTFSVQVEAPQDRLENVITNVSGKTLEVSMKGNNNKNEAKVMVQAPTYESIKTSGTSDVKSTGLIESEKLHISSDGASELKLSIKTTSLDADVSGASEVILTGYTENLNLNASGAAEFEALQLNVNNAKVALSGATDTELNVSKSIEGTTSGASNLELSGNPAVQRIEQSGVSSLNGSGKNAVRVNDDVEEVTVTFNSKEGLKVQESGDTTRITLGKKKLLIVDNWDETNIDLQTSDSTEEPWMYGIDGLFLGVNGFMNSSNKLDVPGGYEFLELDVARSRNVQLTFFDPNIKLLKNYITFHPALSLDFNSYEFKNNYWVQPSSADTGSLSAYTAFSNPADSSELKFSKNRMKATYLNVPIMFGFHTHEDHKKAIHVGLGGYVGTKLTSKMKYKYSLDGENRKDKIHDNYYLNPFRYGLMASLGYSNINFFASYALNGMFEDGKGPELNPFTVGIRVVGF